MKTKTVLGYCDPWSVAPGETVRVMVSTYGAARYDARLVRVICGDDRPSGPGLKEEAVACPIDGVHAGRYQPIAIGSYAVAPHGPALDGLASFTVQMYVWPTTPSKGRQGLVARWSDHDRAGFALAIGDDGALSLTLGDGSGGVECIGTGKALIARQWYFVAASFDAATGAVALCQEPPVEWPTGDATAHVETTVALSDIGGGESPIVMAALPEGAGFAAHFNGKIDRPRLGNRALGRAEMAAIAGNEIPPALAADVLAAWDFGRDIGGERVTDATENGLHGETVNLPSRGAKGHNWTGRRMFWRAAPGEYAAIHFHDDDLYDAGWEADLTFAVPDSARSGAYAVRLEAEGEPFYACFFVRPPTGAAPRRRSPSSPRPRPTWRTATTIGCCTSPSPRSSVRAS